MVFPLMIDCIDEREYHQVEGPSTTISFLRILLDTVHMEIRLPEDKLVQIKDTLSTYLAGKEESYNTGDTLFSWLTPTCN